MTIESVSSDSAARPKSHVSAIRHSFVAGLLLLGVFAGTFGAWAALSTLSGAVVAPGQFVVDSNVKKVQHATGGVVGELKVREGDLVREGQLLVRLDETVLRANLQIVEKQLDELFARTGRLEAERDSAEAIETHPSLAGRQHEPDVAKLIRSERALFEARRLSREGQKAQLTKRIAQSRSEIEGLKAQLASRAQQMTLIGPELAGVRGLYAKNLVPITRVNQLERTAADLVGQRGQIVASMAQSESRIAETELQIIQIDSDLRTEAMRDLREAQGKIAELLERRVAAEDQLRRVDIRSPADGYVHQINVFTVGGVVSPAEPLMLIVPANDGLALEVRIQPQDVDQLAPGRKAVTRVHAFNQRTTPELNGELQRIGADVSKDPQTQAPFYTVRVMIPGEELAKLGGQRLIAGMQADIYIQTEDRSPFEYFIKPLKDQMGRMFRER